MKRQYGRRFPDAHLQGTEVRKAHDEAYDKLAQATTIEKVRAVKSLYATRGGIIQARCTELRERMQISVSLYADERMQEIRAARDSSIQSTDEVK